MRRREKIRVAAAVLVREKEVLIARRGPGRHLAGYWEFPGGKIEPGERDEECLARELLEELSIASRIEDRIDSYTYRYPKGEVEINAYWATAETETFELTVHDEIRWIRPADLQEVKLAPADVPLLRHIFERLG